MLVLTANGLNTGCPDIQDTVEVVITPCPGFDEYSIQHSLQMYPNPTTGELNLSFGRVIDAKVRVYSLVGSMVKEVRIKTDNYRFSVRDVAEGTYILTIETEREAIVKRLVVAR